MPYDPRPIDTSHVSLPHAVAALAERLAENTHDHWAAQRFREGWRHGPTRDDVRKEHPCLIPYDQLPESEKEYDRLTACETVRAILALGHTIREGAPPSSEVLVTEAEVRRLLALDGGSGARPRLTEVLELVGSRRPKTVEAHRVLGRWLYRAGENLLAADVARAGQEVEGGALDGPLRLLQAQSLARAGALGRALELVEELERGGGADQDTLSLVGRIHKDLAALEVDSAARMRAMRVAYEKYLAAYHATDHGYFPGINAATMAFACGYRDEARQLARVVRQKAEADPGIWGIATLAESSLLLEDWPAAEAAYRAFAERARADRAFGDLSTTRRNAALILEHFPDRRDAILEALAQPAVVVFAGHMIDRPGRVERRFPPELEPAARCALGAHLAKLDAGFGYASAACGADLLFLEVMGARSCETTVVLPYNARDFAEDSVGPTWQGRFEAALRAATQVVVASEHRVGPGTATYAYASDLAHGLACIRAAQLGARFMPLALWDGKTGDGPGGTASIVARWLELETTPDVIRIDQLDPTELEPTGINAPDVEVGFVPPTELQPTVTVHGDVHSEVLSSLFADAVGFSKLDDRQIAHFVGDLWGDVAQLAGQVPPEILLTKNTWGDGLFFVFRGVEPAGHFALDLADVVRARRARWAELDLPNTLSMRIALHVGPVLVVPIEPVTERLNCFGSHVTLAARMEPITPPGQVYASQAFAALAAGQRVRSFTCEYVGQIPLAKGYRVEPTYVIRRGRK